VSVPAATNPLADRSAAWAATTIWAGAFEATPLPPVAEAVAPEELEPLELLDPQAPTSSATPTDTTQQVMARSRPIVGRPDVLRIMTVPYPDPAHSAPVPGAEAALA
jgi:hypothetical protein